MPIYKALIEFPFDSALPKDKIAITPHFLGQDPSALAAKLKANLIAHTPVGTKPFNIKIYDAQKAPPNYPLATAAQSGTTPNSSAPRELALCLSYYATVNRPRHRGRLYIPLVLNGITTTTARPTQAQMDNVLLWKNVFAMNAPGTMYWVVFSKRDNQYYPVTDVWCDDEWDVMRSRGLRGTTRSLGAAPP
jgi:hypothetical protein